MNLLIYGAGVIGCLYAALFSDAGHNVTIYARGQRLEILKKNGLLYSQNNRIMKAELTIIDKLEDDDLYDFIFLPVRENQVHIALRELKNNGCPTIVTMVNTLEPYSNWEEICGKGRIVPAFPGAGGSFDENVLHASLTPRFIQPTTFAEISGEKTERLLKLASLFKQAHIPYQIVQDMHAWQLCHLAMVVPIADAYYMADNPEKAGYDGKVMLYTAKQMRCNFSALHKLEIRLTPPKMNFFRLTPVSILSIGLGFVFRSKFGNMFMYRHSMKAPDEMRQLHEQLYRHMENKIEKSF